MVPARHRWIDRQIDRYKDRQVGRQVDRQIDKQTERQTERERKQSEEKYFDLTCCFRNCLIYIVFIDNISLLSITGLPIRVQFNLEYFFLSSNEVEVSISPFSGGAKPYGGRSMRQPCCLFLGANSGVLQTRKARRWLAGCLADWRNGLQAHKAGNFQIFITVASPLRYYM